MSTTAGSHRRDHRSVLAAAEKQLLVAIARRLPAALNSDHLTLLALVAMAAAGAGFAAMRVTPWGALAVALGLVANWFGDSLDGTVARVRGHERPRFGYYIDHVIDLAGTVALCAGLACSGLMTPLMAVAVLAGYLLVAAEAFLATHAGGVLRLSFGGMGPTELRILLMVGALYAAWHPTVTVPWFGSARLFDAGAAFSLPAFAIVFIVSSVRQTRELFRLEPLPRRREPIPPAFAHSVIRGGSL